MAIPSSGTPWGRGMASRCLGSRSQVATATMLGHGSQGCLLHSCHWVLSSIHNTCCTCVQGPEIRTGFLKNPDQPVKLTQGKEITITTDYDHKGDESMISCRSVSCPAPCDLEVSTKRASKYHRISQCLATNLFFYPP